LEWGLAELLASVAYAGLTWPENREKRKKKAKKENKKRIEIKILKLKGKE